MSQLSRRVFLAGATATTALASQNELFKSDEGVYTTENESTVCIGNGNLEIKIRQDNGGIKQIRDRKTGTELRDVESNTPASNWSLTFYSDEYDSVITNSFRAPSPTISQHGDDQRKRISIQWENPQLTSPTDSTFSDMFTATITTEVTLQSDDRLAYWNLTVENNSDYAIKAVGCPNITSIKPIDDNGNDSLIIPDRMGREFPNPTTLEYGTVHRYPGGFGTMQFTAYTSPTGGFYSDTRDPNGHTKELEWDPQPGSNKNRLGYNPRYFVPRSPGEDVTVPYPTTLGVLRGDWYDAADRYREWVLSEGPLEGSTPDIPEWILDKGVTYRIQSYTRFDQVQEDVEFDQIVDWTLDMRDRLDTSLMLMWWGWGKHGFPSAGDWYPPKDGFEAFERTISQLNEEGIETDLFINITGLLITSDYWQNNQSSAENWLIRGRDGSPRAAEGLGLEFYKVETTQDGWQQYIRETLDRLLVEGIRDIQLDGFPWQWVPACFDDDHSHPPGRGGSWYPQQARSDLIKIRNQLTNHHPDFSVGGEGISEFYLPEMNVHNTRDIQATVFDPAVDGGDSRVIPLLQFALGDYYFPRGVLNTPPSTASDQREMLRYWIGRSLVLGMLLMFHFPAPLSGQTTDDRMLDYIGRIGRARETYANRFIARGTLLREPSIDSESTSLRGEEWTVTTDKVLTSAWEASSEEIGIVLTNVSTDETGTAVLIDLESLPFDIPSSQRIIHTVTNGEYYIVSGDNETISSFTVELSPEDVQVVVIEEKTEDRQRALDSIVQAQEVAETSDERAMVDTAKRAFESGDIDTAVEEATKVIQNQTENSPATETRTETRQSTTTGSNQPTSTSDDSPSTTIPDYSTMDSQTRINRSNPSRDTQSDSGGGAPGFTILAGVAGLAGGIVRRFLRGDNENSDE